MEKWILKQRQAMPLKIKILMSQNRIRHFYNTLQGQVYIAFSGGKDSTVLLHLIRSTLNENIPAVFLDTGLEFPEIREFVKTINNVIWLNPKINFKQVLEKYGYPVISKEVSQKLHEIRTTKSEKLKKIRLNGYNNKYKSGKIPEKWKYLIKSDFKISHRCCYWLKKEIALRYEKQSKNKPFLGIMAKDSMARQQNILKTGCNALNTKRIKSMPLAFWLDNNIWEYIKLYNLKYSKIYDMGYKNTGCMFCMFGVHLEKLNKFQLMKTTHPKLYDYCIDKLECGKVLDSINVNYK